MKTLLLTFDIDEFEIAEDYGVSIPEDEQFGVCHEGLIKILSLIDKLGIRVTFFVTYNFAKRYKNLIKKISLKHEINLHGYKHSDDYKKMSDSLAYARLKTAKLGVEKIIGKEIKGFRAPKFQRPKYSILKRLGFKYDSSVNPTFIPGKYNDFFSKRKSFVKDDMRVVPASVVPIIRFPLFWLSFHALNLGLIKFLTRLSLINMRFLCLYFHPWEFVDVKSYNLPKLFSRKTGEEYLVNLENYLKWCLKKGLKSETIAEYLKIK